MELSKVRNEKGGELSRCYSLTLELSMGNFLFTGPSPDWISYGLLDDITDSFALPIRNIEFEVDSIDELVLILKESEQSDMLRRIGHCRKKVMGLLRLLGNKADVIKTLVKRCETRVGEDGRGLSSEVALYLGDVQGQYDTCNRFACWKHS